MTGPSIDYDAVADLYDIYAVDQSDVEYFRRELAMVRGLVLEVTSGTGRLSIPLAKAGVRLTCVDISACMLGRLRTKSSQSGVSVSIVRADACFLPFRPVFESIIFPFQSFMEIVGEARQRSVLEGVRRCLMPGGRFVCTLHNPLLRAGRADGQRHLVGTFPRGGGSLTVSGIETLHNGVVTRRQIFELADADGRIAVVRELAMTFELIPPERLVATARACGLKLVRALGSYQGEPYDPEGSARFIAVLEHSGA